MMKPLKPSNYRDSHPSGTLPSRLSALRMTYFNHYRGGVTPPLHLMTFRLVMSEEHCDEESLG
jgi:hypothetical protein